jgi:DNA invertase Pin-like site-specific DNA recombinase
MSRLHCANHTRKSTEEGLDQAFNSLAAQPEACTAYIKSHIKSHIESQAGEAWQPVQAHDDKGGIFGVTLERPARKRLLADIEAGWVNVVAVYKVDRLTRSLNGSAKIVVTFDANGVSFVSVTQQFKARCIRADCPMRPENS